MISVIIPVYNSSEYLRECLDSVVGQSYSDLEIICINDGSTDHSLDILSEYSASDSRIIVVNQDNSGASLAKQRGLKESTGEFIAFLDSDDTIELNLYERLINTLSPQSDMVVFNYEEGGRDQGHWDEALLIGENILEEYIDGKIHNKLNNKLYKRNCFNNVVFPSKRDVMEDACVMSQILLNVRQLNRVSRGGYYYRIVPTSLSRKRLSNYKLCGKYRNEIDKIGILLDNCDTRDNALCSYLMTVLEGIIINVNEPHHDVWNAALEIIHNNYDRIQASSQQHFMWPLINWMNTSVEKGQNISIKKCRCIYCGYAIKHLHLKSIIKIIKAYAIRITMGDI